jgi:hypothetical protein
LSRPKAKVCGIRCVDQLKQAGLAFRMWSNDQGEKFPWQVSTNQGGTLELTESGDPLPHFQAVSNELNTPKVLVCSSDTTRVRVASFDQFTNRSQLSYFVGLDADETRPNSILTGDRSVSTNGQFHSGLIGMATSAPLNWAGGIHPPGLGNIGLGDGSAQQFANGPFWFQCAPDTNPVIRLVIP